MKKTCLYVGAFVLSVIAINLGFYLVPVYHLPWSGHAIAGPFSIYLAYFIFGLPPVLLYFRWVLKDSWLRALVKGAITVLVYVIVAGSFAFVFLRSNGTICRRVITRPSSPSHFPGTHRESARSAYASAAAAFPPG